MSDEKIKIKLIYDEKRQLYHIVLSGCKIATYQYKDYAEEYYERVCEQFGDKIEPESEQMRSTPK